MEGKVFLVWVILLLGQLHGYKSCIEKERKALLELKTYLIPMTEYWEDDSALSWTNVTKSDCCQWKGVECNRKSGQITKIAFGIGYLKKINPLLNLSLLHPFEEVQSLNLSSTWFGDSGFSGLFDDVEDYKSLRRLRNLEILDLSGNRFNNSIFRFLNAAPSLKTLFLRHNNMDGPLLVKELKDLTNLEHLDLSVNRFNGSIQDYESLRRLRKLEILDLSQNSFNSSIFPFLNAATSLKTLLLGDNNMGGPFLVKELKDLTNLEHLDLSGNRFNGSIQDYESLRRLRKLEILDLSGNLFNSSIFPFLNAATSLKTLLLGYNNMGGPLLVKELKDLTNLEHLDLSANRFNGSIPIQDYESLRRLRKLEILDLSDNSFNSSIFPVLNAATSLKSLFLRENNMGGPFLAKELRDLTNLELLDLSINRFNGSIPVRELSALRKLKALDLSYNEFSSLMELQGTCKWKNIKELDLSQNKLVGQFPSCLTSFTGLRVLDLSSNQLTGNVPSSLGNLESLKYLSLSNNNFKGFFSVGSLANLTQLKVFKLESYSNSLQVEFETSWKPKFQLSVIVLRSCNLEKVPHFILHQKDLRHVDLSDNKIHGNFPSWVLENNTKLEVLLLQNNSLTSFQLPKSAHSLHFLNVSVNKFNHLFPQNFGWILPQLLSMNLANNGFQGNIPSSLGNMKNVEFLDLSHNSFHGKLPRRFLKGCYNLTILKLSHNKLSGEVFPESANFTRIDVLSMDNNLFTGKIGKGLRSLTSLFVLDISNNNLTGVIPSWIGELTELFSLQLSNNLLEGEIPTSLLNLSYLRLLDLSSNRLSGDIPPHVNKYQGFYGAVLLLQDNNLSGVIPDTLLRNVKVLDLRNNRLSGNLPEFINTQNISILLLRGNNFTGHIPHQFCGLSNIQLLDLANNKLNGSIPSCFSGTSFGLRKEDDSNRYDIPNRIGTAMNPTYFKSLLLVDKFDMVDETNTQTKIEFATKHRYDAYMGRNLNLLFGMDLSENELSGEIPTELGGLMELQALNLSHNNFTGAIPESFSGLKNVESLDLSFNRLQGRIPPQLTDLNSLAVFNLSYNNLSGIIPQERQFNTFDTQSYIGNLLLCGKPTNLRCESDNFQEPYTEVEADESLINVVSFYWSFAAAYATILLGIFVSLSFDSPWSRAWFYIVDVFIHKAKSLLW